MAKRIIKRIRIAKTKPIHPRRVAPTEPAHPPEATYFEPPEAAHFEPESEPAARAATPREIIAEQLKQRCDEIARTMAAAQADVTAATDRAALDLQRLPAREVAVPDKSPWPVDPAIETAAEAAVEAMHAATRAVEAAGRGIEATASFMGAEAAAVDRTLVEAMHATDRSIADGLRAAERAVAATVGGGVDGKEE